MDKTIHGLAGSRFARVLIAATALALGGCAATHGNPPIVSSAGVTTSVKTGVAGKFVGSAEASYSSAKDAELAKAMLKDGFTLISVSCNEFFDTAGNTQRWMIVSRDVVGAVGTVATGVLALHGGHTNSIANIAFVTAGTYAGLDIYTKNFLFAAENVESVRTLVQNALKTHRTPAEALDGYTYQTAIEALMYNQNLCSPMRIAQLARDAIKKGDVVASEDPADALSPFTRAQDQKAQSDLAVVFNTPSPLSVEQSGALWWLAIQGADATEKTGDILPKLKDLPATTSPFATDGTEKADWALRPQVTSVLRRFSAPTQLGFETAIAKVREDRKKAAATPPAPAAPAGGGVPVPGAAPAAAQAPMSVQFTHGAAAVQGRTARPITVDIR